MKILYIGADRGTSRLRFQALSRLGHETHIVDPYDLLPKGYLTAVWALRTGAFGLGELVCRRVLAAIGPHRYDLVLVDNGENVSSTLVKALKRKAKKVINFNQDNPYVKRDGLRWRLFLKALSHYDLVVVPRASNVARAYRAGARNVLLVNFAADELVHRPVSLSVSDQRLFGSEVAFVGTWMPERGQFMNALISRGVPITIFGPQWHHASKFPRIAQHVRIGGLLDTPDYVKAVAATKVAIALVSKGNEDLHTTRSVEIPAIGTLLCGERTADHTAMYSENSEAIFFEGAEDCAHKCLELLANPDRLMQVAEAGRRRAIANANFNEPLLRKMLEAAFNLSAMGEAQGSLDDGKESFH